MTGLASLSACVMALTLAASSTHASFAGATASFNLDKNPSCVSGYGDAKCKLDLFPHKVEPKFSEGWNVTYGSNYKIIHNKMAEQTIVGYLCGTTPPAIEKLPGWVNQIGEPIFLELPIKSAAIVSTTHIINFELINELKSIKATATGGWEASACLQDQIYEGKTKQTTYDGKYGDERVEALFSVDSVFTNVVTENPVVLMSEFKETNNLAKAEWVKYVSLFYNKEQAATSIVQTIESEYQCAKDVVASAKDQPVTKPKVLWGAWSRTGCPSYYCEVVIDAGAEMVGRDRAMSDDEFLRYGADADYWIFPQFKSSGDTGTAYGWLDFYDNHKDLIHKMKAYKNKAIYGVMERNWLEARLAMPQELLIDMITIVQPHLNAGRNTVTDNEFLFNLITGEGHKGIGMQCIVEDGQGPTSVKTGCALKKQVDLFPDGIDRAPHLDIEEVCPRVSRALLGGPNDASALAVSPIALFGMLVTAAAMF